MHFYSPRFVHKEKYSFLLLVEEELCDSFPQTTDKEERTRDGKGESEIVREGCMWMSELREISKGEPDN